MHASATAIEPDTNHPPVEDQAHNRLVGQQAGVPVIQSVLTLRTIR
jgi:hypothetical protein